MQKSFIRKKMFKYRKHYRFLLLTLFATVLFRHACYVPQQTQVETQPRINLANMYNPKATTIFPKFSAYLPNDSTVTIYTYLYLPQLAFRNYNNKYTAKIYINVKLTPSFENRTAIDTLSKVLLIKQNKYQKSLIFPLSLTPVKDSAFLVNIYVKDLFRNKANIGFINIDRQSRLDPATFLVRYADDFKPVFGIAVYPEYQYLVSHNSKEDTLFAFHYKLDTTIPNPPFYTESRALTTLYADTVFPVPVTSPVSFEEKGIYLFSTSRYKQQGRTLIYFSEDFPVIKRASEMIPPLKYLTSKDEFARLKNSISPKLTVDSFWLDIAEQPAKAKSLIKTYYNRVFLANVYFTSYKEGWKTDRGMIYIIFGLPHKVYKYDDKEVWYYYDKNLGQYVVFTFIKRKNRFSDNCYTLKPDMKYRKYWKNAVQQWRSGIIPSF